MKKERELDVCVIVLFHNAVLEKPVLQIHRNAPSSFVGLSYIQQYFCILHLCR